MDKHILKGNVLLLLAASLWGSTFVAQRMGMDSLGPLTYTGLRFLLGTLCLLPFLLWQQRRGKTFPGPYAMGWKKASLGVVTAGLVLCVAINLQQKGLVYTSAGNAGFITGLYVVIVPFLGMILRQIPGKGELAGAVLAVTGLYFLSITQGFALRPGDGWVLAGAFGWASHVCVIAWLSPRMDSIRLAFGQFGVCALVSLAAAVVLEDISLAAVWAAGYPILYGGVLSVSVAFTLQVIAQKSAPPTHAAVIMSLETVFAALSGWWILGEVFSGRQVLGCGFMLTGMLFTQISTARREQG